MGKNGKVVGGDIEFQGKSLINRTPEELRHLRGAQVSMVYQDPMTSLNPVLRVGDQLTEVLTAHRQMNKSEAVDQCIAMLERVYMPDPERVMQSYPHQISGGQQQRIVIAMAMLNNPVLLIMDEPTTSLDVTVEAAVLDLVADLRQEFDTAILFITHNLGVISRVCDRVGVMYAGEMVELAPVNEIFARPRHPYTRGLIRCLPKLGRTKASSVLYPIRGRVPAPDQLPPGCVFGPRCDISQQACLTTRPELDHFAKDHTVRCIYADQIETLEKEVFEELAPIREAVTEAEDNNPILRLNDVQVYYPHRSDTFLGSFGLGKKEYIRAVDGITFDVAKGMTLGIVGESGCGKSTLAKGIIGLEDITGGEAQFLSFQIQGRVHKRDLNLIRELQMVFQNPDSTLNPRYSVGRQISRPLLRFKVVPKNEVRSEVIRLLNAVKLDEHYYDRLPRQLSGGEKQRVGIARAFAGRPDLVLCDEPVSALDVSVQAAVLNLLLEIQKTYNTTIMFIAHDLSVVRFFSDYVAVMYLGQVVEIGPAEAIYAPPYHPYTESLLAAVPIPDPPSPLNPPSGCRFHTRCPRREMLPDGGIICEREEPPFIQAGENHNILCHIPLEQLAELDPVIHS